MKRGNGILVAIVLLALAGGASFYAYSQREPHFDVAPITEYYRRLPVRDAQSVDLAVVRDGISAAQGYLARNTLPSGQFVYLVNMNPEVEVAPGYNMLRHAGAIYALDLANRVVPDPESVGLMERSTKFMRECCFAEVDGYGSGMWEPPAVTGGSPTRARVYKLGGVGLSIVALSSLEHVKPGSASRAEMDGFARFGRYLMKWNGAFYPRHVPDHGGRQASGDVLFYPGEMVLGWLAMYEHYPSPELVEWSVKGLMNLARERAELGEAPPDHWSLLATSDLFRLAKRDDVEIPRDALINHALKICHNILEESYAPPVFPEMDGSLVSRGNVISTAARLEGLLAALTFLPRDHPIYPHLESAVHRGIAFVLRAQVKDGPFAGGFPLAIMKLPPSEGMDVANFNAQATEIRIDHMQHSLSAIARYLAWIHAQSEDATAAGG